MAAGDITSGSRLVGFIGPLKAETCEIVTNGTGAVTFTTRMQSPKYAFAQLTEAPDATTSIFTSISGQTVTIDASAASGTKKAIILVIGY